MMTLLVSRNSLQRIHATISKCSSKEIDNAQEDLDIVARNIATALLSYLHTELVESVRRVLDNA